MADENEIMEDGQMTSNMAELAEMVPGELSNDASHNMDFLLDIPLEISVELGRTKITIGDLLKLSQGSVVELNKLTDEPLEIFVNKKLMAQGEVVVVNEKFGIRLTNIISPSERVKDLT
ncbi:MAG: flagellar motor switch protein FliN [Deltaproteobacteria bacterium]|nr:flagellar motor switch protein FliN [Deltaproteobacteria bacterium]MBW1914974.1 flagellar motor switch protein FliN [Deltaproteobacteria bacterium]